MTDQPTARSRFRLWADYLRARIAEDQRPTDHDECDCDVPGLPLQHGYCCPVRVLADCRAKHELIDLALDICEATHLGVDPESPLTRGIGVRIFQNLARPYVDRPDFRETWQL